MLIDGFTIAAQVINFLVLVFLLKKFLYGPIIRVMEARETRIKKAVEQADTAEKEAGQRVEALAAEQAAFSESKAKLLADAKTEVAQWRESQLENLRKEISDLRLTWIDKLDQERETFLTKLKKETVRQIMHISEKVLRDLADQQLEDRIISVFMQKMETHKEAFPDKGYAGTFRVVSGFELAEENAADIKRKLQDWFPSLKEVHFDVSTELGIGIEVIAGDKKTTWNLEKYMKDLENEILMVLPAKGRDLQ